MNKQLLLSIIFLININLFSQNTVTEKVIYKAIYNIAYLADSTNVYSTRSEKMLLYIGTKHTLFESENNKYNDSIKKDYLKNTNSTIQDLPKNYNSTSRDKKRTRFKYKIYTTLNKIKVIDFIFTDRYVYNEKVNFNWKISSETKTINTYLCKKAVTFFSGRKYEAWFTEELPINSGPYKFSGLPGLIVKIQDTKNNYIFELLSFEKTNNSFELNNSKVIKTTKKDFFRAYSNFKENITHQLSLRGFEMDEANKIKLQENIKRNRNNMIEIKIN